MTRDDIMRMAREAGMKHPVMGDEVSYVHFSLERFANLVLKAERQACADPNGKLNGKWTALYTATPQRKPLTDEEIVKISDLRSGCYGTTEFARAIEQAHGIGEKE